MMSEPPQLSGNELPRWQAHLGGTFTVECNGKDLGPPPSKATAVLLAGLLARPDTWIFRDELARRLYPGKPVEDAKTALRQSISRLKEWVGADAVKIEHSRLKAARKDWLVDLTLPNGQPAAAPQISPGISHPWFDQMRSHWGANQDTENLSPVQNHFEQLVLDSIELDVDLARSILAGGQRIFESLEVGTQTEFLARTRPKSRSDPYAREHMEMTGTLLLRSFIVRDALAAYQRAYRMAAQARDRANAARISGLVLFTFIESGDFDSAENWNNRMRLAGGGGQLTQINAKAAFLWNAYSLDEAIVAMKEGEAIVESADRAQQAHFWSNFAVLAAEANQRDFSELCSENARRLMNEQLDLWIKHTLLLAGGTRAMMAGNFPEAFEQLETLRRITQEQHYLIEVLYAEEALAEANARAGDLKRAAELWRHAEKTRKGAQVRLTPRLLARKKRIMQRF